MKGLLLRMVFAVKKNTSWKVAVEDTAGGSLAADLDF